MDQEFIPSPTSPTMDNEARNWDMPDALSHLERHSTTTSTQTKLPELTEPTYYTILPRPQPPSNQTSFYLSTPTFTSTTAKEARLQAISNDPDLTKRQKKRHMKKQRKKDRIFGDEHEIKEEQKPKVYNATNPDDFPPLGPSPPPPLAPRRVSEASKETYDFPPIPKHRIRAGSLTTRLPPAPSISHKIWSGSATINASIHPAAMTTPLPPGTRSTSWISSTSALKDKFERLQKNAGHLQLLNSTVLPQTVGEYARHLMELKTEKIKWDKRKIEARVEEKRKTGVKREVLVLGRGGGGGGGVEVLGKDESDSGGKYQKYIPTDTIASNEQEQQGWSTKTPEMNRIERGHFGKGGIGPVDETIIWDPRYVERPEKRGAKGTVSRAAWPDQNELKAEGEMRARIFGKRRLPLPRFDRYGADAFASKMDKGATQEELETVKGEDIPWYERDPVVFKGLDNLESIERERCSTAKTWTHEGVNTSLRRHAHAGSRGRFSYGSRDMTSMMGGGGMTSPGYGMDALTENFATMGSPELGGFGFGYQGGVDTFPQGHRSMSGPAAGYSANSPGFTPSFRARSAANWTDTNYGTGYQHSESPVGGPNVGDMYAHYVASGRQASPQRTFATPHNPDYEALSWGADGYGDGKLPPPGGWKFDEEHLRDRGWKDFLKEL
jgi:hypothetical protein